MAKNAGAKRTEAKKAQKAADSPFFRPFASLQSKGKKPAKGDAKKDDAKPQAPGKKEVTSPKASAQRAAALEKPPEAESAPPPEVTFAMYMAGVRALEERSTRVPTSKTEVAPRPKPVVERDDPDEEARAALHSLVSEGFRFEITDDGERIEGRRIDVDPRELRRLRRGAYTIDGRLDLHGKNVVEARREVEKFVGKRRADGDRVVAMIVGRGSHSPRGIGVLRGEIAAWLSQGPAAHHVKAFASAPEEDGGSGVVLALLAR